MSLELFHEVPAGAIETLFDEQNQPLFERADLGKCPGLENIKNNLKDLPSHNTRLRLDLERDSQASPLGRMKNPINLDGSIEMAIRSKKPIAVALVKWLSKKDVEKIQEEHQQAIEEKDNQIKALEHTNEKHQQCIEEKDTTIALLNDDLKNREHDNVALQGQRDAYKKHKNPKTSLPILKNVMLLMQKIQAKATLL